MFYDPYTLTFCSLDCFCGMVDVYNYFISVVNILTFTYFYSRKGRATNIIIYLRQEAELQILDHQFRTRVNNAMRNIATIQQNQMNAVNDNNNNEMDQLSHSPPDEEPPD